MNFLNQNMSISHLKILATFTSTLFYGTRDNLNLHRYRIAQRRSQGKEDRSCILLESKREMRNKNDGWGIDQI